MVRERAISNVIFSIYNQQSIKQIFIHEVAPSDRGLSVWFKKNMPINNYICTGYWPNRSMGILVNGMRNENIEMQTFTDESFDLVIHLDVLEHVFNPFQALKEIYRTLKPGGYCIFTAPTEHNRFKSEQVAWVDKDNKIQTIGVPEYHGNPQRPEDRALVTWRYGYDLPLRISRETQFDIEVRRWQSRSIGIMGYMTEVYILHKTSCQSP